MRAVLLALLLAGCTQASLRRDMEVEGNLPRMLGFGASAPSCFLFCFVRSSIEQGDSTHEGDSKDPVSVNDTLEIHKGKTPRPKKEKP